MARTFRIEDLSDGRFRAVDERGQGYEADSPTAAFEAAWSNAGSRPGITYPPAGHPVPAFADAFEECRDPKGMTAEELAWERTWEAAYREGILEHRRRVDEQDALDEVAEEREARSPERS